MTEKVCFEKLVGLISILTNAGSQIAITFSDTRGRHAARLKTY